MVLYPSDFDFLVARVFSLEFFNSFEGVMAVRTAVEMEGEDFFHNVYPFIYLVRVCSIIKIIFWPKARKHIENYAYTFIIAK